MQNLRHNETIDTLLNRRSIRAFCNEAIDEDTVATLETVAQRAACSQFLNDWSAIKITNSSIKQKLSEIGNQTYIATAPLLYVFIIDQHRNAAIAQKMASIQADEFMLKTRYRFTQAQNDVILALHTMETAAESLGLGCVILGSILNSRTQLIDILNLPEYTYPVLGLAIGKPAQNPELKPRMSTSMQIFENTYPADDAELLENLADFDNRVHQYYDLRNTSRPVDAFSAQILAIAADDIAKKHEAEDVEQVAGQGFNVA